MNDKEYEDIKELFLLLKSRYIGNLNELCNFEDTIILCEILSVLLMNDKYKFNPQRCNSASKLSRCIH